MTFGLRLFALVTEWCRVAITLKQNVCRMFGAPEYASGSFNHERYFHNSVIIVRKAKEKCLLVELVC